MCAVCKVACINIKFSLTIFFVNMGNRGQFIIIAYYHFTYKQFKHPTLFMSNRVYNLIFFCKFAFVSFITLRHYIKFMQNFIYNGIQ